MPSDEDENDFPWLWAGPPLYYRRTVIGTLLNPFTDIELFNKQENEKASRRTQNPTGDRAPFEPPDTSSQAASPDNKQTEARKKGDFQIASEERYYHPMRDLFMQAVSSENLEIGPCGVPLPSGVRLPFTRIPEDVFKHVRWTFKKK